MKMRIVRVFMIFFLILFLCPAVGALPVSEFNSSNGWVQFADDDGIIGPGGGGQAFDAEYFFYQYHENILSLGLQTGFDLEDGMVKVGGVEYYAGDLALSFDGNNSYYEYAVDFGLKTKDYLGNKVGNNKETTGIDPAGLYEVTEWNTNIYFLQSKPCAMDSGVLVENLTENSWGKEGNSYYRIVSFDISPLSDIISGEDFTVNAHWIMSCGNDVIDGSFTETPSPNPEPATFLLLGSSLILVAGLKKKKIKCL